MQFRLLLVDDQRMFLDLTKKFLEENGFIVDAVSSGREAVERVKAARTPYALIVLDYVMENMDGAKATKEIMALRPDQFILMYSSDLSRTALQNSWKAGAVEFVDKGAPLPEFLSAVKLWCDKYRETREVLQPPTPSENSKKIHSIGLVGSSFAMAKVADLVQKYRSQKGTVLILGESGTGKERIAKALHADNRFPFVAVNCASYNGEATLMESELFGIEKDSFTGAARDKKGVFEEVGRGTVFLDEIHALSLKAQQKLLRALQERSVRPVGGSREYKVHFRLVAAAKPDLEALVERGEFLPDLFYRLNVLSITLPTLRERPQDIAPLVAHFAAIHAPDPDHPKQFLSRTVAQFEKFSWPGNVRELENIVERLCATVPGDKISPEDLDPKLFAKKALPSNLQLSTLKTQNDSMTKDMVVRVIQESRSQREAARKLGVPHSTFHDLLKRFGINGGTRRGRVSHPKREAV